MPIPPGLDVEAASVAADRVLARTETTVMPAEQFDAMLAALDVPDDAPALARLALTLSTICKALGR
ncbi:MAG: hypothetical protein ACRDSZ_09285 [Pseudonocardiaceae bacterium]